MDQKLEEYNEREESMGVQIEQLTEENIRSKRSLVDMHRVVRARKNIEALGEDLTAEEFLDAVVDRHGRSIEMRSSLFNVLQNADVL